MTPYFLGIDICIPQRYLDIPVSTMFPLKVCRRYDTYLQRYSSILFTAHVLYTCTWALSFVFFHLSVNVFTSSSILGNQYLPSAYQTTLFDLNRILGCRMPTTPVKRIASTSPDGVRPYKRLATSSPEEGELDDTTPPPPPRPATPPKSKVPFPFKRKTIARDEKLEPYANGEPKGRAQYGYERPDEDELRFRNDDERRWRPPRHDTRGADRWEPSAGRYDGGARLRWERPEPSYGPSHYPSSERRDYPPRPPLSPRRAWSRSRSPSSPRSHSPSTPVNREKHRLPPPRPISPLADAYYQRDRDRDNDYKTRSRSRDRRRDSPDVREREPAWAADDESDRNFRPPQRGDERDRWRDRGQHDDNHRPMSPRRPISPLSPMRRSSGRKTPPPPSTAPPPPPTETYQVEVLPTAHTAIKFALPPKKPLTPLNVYSPPSLPVPNKTNVVPKGETMYAMQQDDSQPEPGEVKVAPPKPKRKPVVRSREEEAKVYGRMFAGCGRQEDYDVLTKLGEGTFGYVRNFQSALWCSRGSAQ